MHTRSFEYRGKHYTVPEFGPEGYVVEPARDVVAPALPADSPILAKIGTIWDLENFRVARRPVELGLVPAEQRPILAAPGLPRTLDLPIKFPGSAFRVPQEFAQLRWLIQRVADLESVINPRLYDEFYCYMTVDQ